MTNVHSDVIPTIESRVGKLEGAVESLIHNFSTFASETTNAVNKIAENQSQFQNTIRAELSKANAPKWPLVVGVATFVTTILALAITVLTIILSGQSGAVATTNHNLDNLQEKVYAVKYDVGKLEGNVYDARHCINNLKEWRLAHTESNAFTLGSITTKLNMLYDDCTDFRRATASNRWTKQDQQEYEKRMDTYLQSLRQELSCLKK